MATISFNPNLTVSPANPFLVQTEGYVQGAYFDDPTTRQWLTSGLISSAVTGPVYGGMSLTELVNAPNANQAGNLLELAAGYTTLTAFSVMNQANNAIIVPGNSAQMSFAGTTISYFRLGSNARIAVQCSSTLANTLDAGAINQQVSWDFTNQMLIPFSTTALPVKVLSVNTNSKIIVNTSGVLTYSTGAVAIIQI